MKKILIMIVLAAAAMNANAQESYMPMLKDGRVWNCIEVYQGEEKNDTVTCEYRIEEASEMDGHVCYNLCMGDKQMGVYYEEGPKVFHYTTNGWELLFDFSLSTGEAAPNSEGLIVDEVKTVVIKGEPRRCLYFPLTSVDGTKLCWIEGIGSSLCGPYSYNVVIGSLLNVKLLSVYDDDVCIFEADDLTTTKKTANVTIDGVDYFLYLETHEAVLTRGGECSGELDIPSEVSYNGETFVVTGMIWKAFYDCPELTKVRVPKTLEDVMHYYPNDSDEGDIETILISSEVMNPFSRCPLIESIEVDKDNPSMNSVDGVLFSKDGTRLYAYPSGKKAKSYVVPQGVTWIGIEAVSNANLRKIDLPESVQTICSDAFRNCTFDVMIIRGVLDTPSINNSLEGCLSESAIIYVLATEVERYRSLYPGIVLPIEEYDKEDPVTFTAGQMATITLPTVPDASKGKYYRLDRCEKGQIIFEQELHPQARTPYIIVPDEDFSIDLATLDLAGLSRDTVAIEGISFIGTYVRTELPALTGEDEGGSSFYVDIIDITPDCTPLPGEGQGERLFIGAMRAYLLVNWDDPIYYGGTRGKQEKLRIVLKDYETGVDEIQNSNFKNQNEEGSIIYDLSGRRVNNSKFKVQSSKPQRGIYIENGRKVVK